MKLSQPKLFLWWLVSGACQTSMSDQVVFKRLPLLYSNHNVHGPFKMWEQIIITMQDNSTL